jgi:hypothetical protein
VTKRLAGARFGLKEVTKQLRSSVNVKEQSPAKAPSRKEEASFSFAPLRLCGRKFPRVLQFKEQIDRKKQSYSERHGAENSRQPKIQFVCM